MTENKIRRILSVDQNLFKNDLELQQNEISTGADENNCKSDNYKKTALSSKELKNQESDPLQCNPENQLDALEHECEECKDPLSLSEENEDHSHNQTNESNLQCQNNLSDEKPSTLQNPETNPRDLWIYKCDSCQEKFKSQFRLNVHNKEYHSKLPALLRHKCSSCPRFFSSEEEVKSHESIHTDPKLIQCKICGKSFPQIAYYKQHQRTHTNIRPYNCSSCDKSFKTTFQLKAHEQGHLISYVCTVCGKYYKSENYLRHHHDRVHSSSKLNNEAQSIKIEGDDFQMESEMEFEDYQIVEQ